MRCTQTASAHERENVWNTDDICSKQTHLHFFLYKIRLAHLLLRCKLLMVCEIQGNHFSYVLLPKATNIQKGITKMIYAKIQPSTWLYVMYQQLTLERETKLKSRSCRQLVSRITAIVISLFAINGDQNFTHKIAYFSSSRYKRNHWMEKTVAIYCNNYHTFSLMQIFCSAFHNEHSTVIPWKQQMRQNQMWCRAVAIAQGKRWGTGFKREAPLPFLPFPPHLLPLPFKRGSRV